MTISGCDASPCTFEKGDLVEVSVKFTTTSAVQDLTEDVEYTIDGITAPVPGMDGESACGKLRTTDGSSAECPLESGTTYIFTDSIQVPEILPAVNFFLNFNSIFLSIMCY